MFRIRGYSGCKLEVRNFGVGSIVRKYSSGPAYSHRLQAQAQKQTDFPSHISLDSVVIPRVRAIEEHHFDMDFFHGYDAITFFSQCDRNGIDRFCKTILKFIDVEIEKSKQTKFNIDAFLAKYHDVCRNFGEHLSVDVNRISAYFHSLPKALIPHGLCHGDLTLSNILFGRSGVRMCMIDLLDTFYETPLQDMVKLKQDTKYRWSAFLFEHAFDSVRYSIVMHYIDARIEEHFLKYDFYQTYYPAFQIMNFLRILPYARTPAVEDFLTSRLEEMVTTWT